MVSPRRCRLGRLLLALMPTLRSHVWRSRARRWHGLARAVQRDDLLPTLSRRSSALANARHWHFGIYSKDSRMSTEVPAPFDRPFPWTVARVQDAVLQTESWKGMGWDLQRVEVAPDVVSYREYTRTDAYEWSERTLPSGTRVYTSRFYRHKAT